jgi:hypothetical protein
MSQEQVLHQILQRLHALELENAQLRHAATTTPAPEPKVKTPDVFDGDRKTCRDFLNQVELIFTLCPRRYPTDTVKVGFIGTLLVGRALSWFSLFWEQQNVVLNNSNDFIGYFRETFDDLDKEFTAGLAIKCLRQGKTSVLQYTNEFRQLAGDLGWNEKALIAQYRWGLSDEIKDMLLHHDHPNSLQEAIQVATRIENRLREHQLELRSGESRITKPHSFRKPQVLVKPQEGPVPMELGHSSRGPLTMQERQRRREQGLCLYCGSDKHFRRDCPVAPTTKKVQALERAPEIQNKQEEQVQSGKVLGQ